MTSNAGVYMNLGWEKRDENEEVEIRTHRSSISLTHRALIATKGTGMSRDDCCALDVAGPQYAVNVG